MKLEVCASNLASAMAAQQGGAGRIELCSALSVGGLTPSYGLLQHVSTATHLQIMTLIRPREGNFVYTDGEVQIMEQDIHALRPMCSGFVFGALTPQGDIDMHAMERLMKAAQGVPVTFIVHLIAVVTRSLHSSRLSTWGVSASSPRGNNLRQRKASTCCAVSMSRLRVASSSCLAVESSPTMPASFSTTRAAVKSMPPVHQVPASPTPMPSTNSSSKFSK